MNTINRHNYETWFLLWIDGELSAQDMEMVERFIADNPDLAEELLILQEARLPIDETIVFPNKASLLKQETDAISLANYETYFLLYVDNELSTAQKQATELFVLQHPGLQENFLLLQQTKLVAEAIEFSNKEILYRKEEKKKPVIFMRWSSMAVAAAFFGLVAALWFVIPQNNLKEKSPIPVEKATAKTPINTRRNDLVGQVTASTGKNYRLADKRPLEPINQPFNESTTKRINALPDQRGAFGREETVSQTNINKEPEVTAALEKTLNTNQVEQTGVKVNAEYDTNSSITKFAAPEENKLSEAQQAALKNNEEDNTASLVRPAVYKELDTNDEDKSLYIGALEINKDKLRGFLRKAGSVFRSKSKQEEDTRILK